ncbi:Extracellular basic protease precursor [Planctomycetes bacterium Poly30]|uniref:Extracellular basic protease n=1 Tax=Saltatorellus ferox TaxID=2528018 RepID=A0A518ER16_9BACT|nr:Extracellular basic protease precursor [Planctomycetes bacterium Poly30]
MIRLLDSGRRRGFLLAGVLGLGLSACGGGSDSGGDPGAGDRLTGTLSVLASEDTVLEAEPNDVLSQAHILGELRAGQTKTVVGATATTDQDIFQVVVPERAEIAVSLNGQDVTSDIDVYFFDPVSLQQVAAFASNSSSESGAIVARGTFLALVEAAAGSSDYEFVMTASAPGASIAEVEPNDSAAAGQYVGMFDNTDSLTFTGNGSGASSDFLLLSVAEASTFNVSLSFDGAEDYDVFAYDVSANLGSPLLIDSLTGIAVPEVGQIDVSAMTLVALEIRPINGAVSAYTLQLDGNLARLSGGSQAGTALATPLARLSTAARGSRLPSRFPSFRGDVIVQLRPDGDVSGEPGLSGASARMGRTVQRLDDVVRSFGGQVVDAVPDGPGKVHFDLPAELSDEEAQRYTFALAASLRGKPDVLIAEPDFVLTAFAAQQTPNDPFYNLQWHYEQIQLPAAWGLTTGSGTVRVAVLDTGSAPSSDLPFGTAGGYDMIADPSIAGDGNGRDNDPTDVGDSTGIQPSSFHGAHVAGTIGALSDNNKGVAGVSWQSSIFHVRCLGKGGGSTFDILNAVLYAAGLSNASNQTTTLAHVQNMSLGGGGFSQTFQNAINDATAAGSLIIAAAGNENSSSPSYPAAYGNVISVAAVDYDQRRAPYSNFHPTVDIAAPGGDVSADRNGDGYADGVLSTKPDDSVTPTNFENYSFYQGTSMAAPHVAGVAALMLALDPTLTPAELTTILTSTATDLGAAGRDNLYGEGLVNAFAACQAAAGGGGGGGPVLSLDESIVLFQTATGTRRVGVANVGDGLLDVTSVSATTNTGGNWLSASRVIVPQAGSTNTSAVELTVSASGLANGVYSGSVTVQSNGGTAMLGVTLSLGGSTTTTAYEVFVIAVDAVSYNSVAQDVVVTNGSLGYALSGVPAGTYIIVAGTDEDGDDFICDEGEPLCGLYPSLGLPVEVTVSETGTISGLNFPLEQATFSSASVGGQQGFRLPVSHLRAKGDDASTSDTDLDNPTAALLEAHQ